MAVAIEKTNKKTGQVETRLYETVAERVRKFRSTFPIDKGWALVTDISFPDEETVLAVARVLDPDNREIARGTAEERRNASYINRTSAVENAETSAIGRCLFAAGFGGGEFCSAEELINALRQQKELMAAQIKLVEEQDRPPLRPVPSRDTSAGKEQKPANGLGSAAPTIPGVTFRSEGDIIIAEGQTFQSKGLLKSAGFVWNKVKPKAWAKKTKEGGNT